MNKRKRLLNIYNAIRMSTCSTNYVTCVILSWQAGKRVGRGTKRMSDNWNDHDMTTQPLRRREKGIDYWGWEVGGRGKSDLLEFFFFFL